MYRNSLKRSYSSVCNYSNLLSIAVAHSIIICINVQEDKLSRIVKGKLTKGDKDAQDQLFMVLSLGHFALIASYGWFRRRDYRIFGF